MLHSNNYYYEKEFIPSDIYNYLKKSIVCQDEALKDISVAVYMHYHMHSDLIKNNILLNGPSGTGKTEIFRQLSKFLKDYVMIEDLSQYTPPGYRGPDLENIFQKLFEYCDYDCNRTENAIVCLDEFDKITMTDNSSSGEYNVISQQSMLKLFEGKEVEVKNRRDQCISTIDTGKILFIASGSFYSMEEKMRIEKRTIGIYPNDRSNAMKETPVSKFLIPELDGRFPIVINTNPLSAEDLYKIVSKSDISFVKELSALFLMKGIRLYWKKETLWELCKTAEKEKTGVRGIQKEIHKMIKDIVFRIDTVTGSEIIL